MTIDAHAFKFGDDINTDYIIAGKYKFKSNDMDDMAHHAMEELDPNYYERVKPQGGILVAGKNFGMGSSREQAPLVLIHSNTKAVVAKSFARIFYRNAINIGLPIVVSDIPVAAGDELAVDLSAGVIENLTQHEKRTFAPFPAFLQGIVAAGGLMQAMKTMEGGRA